MKDFERIDFEKGFEIKNKRTWEEINDNLEEFWQNISSITLSPDSLYYYTCTKRDSIVKPKIITEKQRKLVFTLINGIIKNPNKYEDYYKPIFECFNNIDSLNSNLEIMEEFKRLNFEGFEEDKDVKANKAKLKKLVTADRGYGLFGEILSYTVEEAFFGDNLLISKIASITAAGTFSHGSDGLFYNSSTDTIIYGEAKFTKDLKSGLIQALDSISEFESRLSDDVSYVLRCTRQIKNNYEEYFEELTPEELLKKKMMINVFVLHGVEYQDESIDGEIKNYYNRMIKCLPQNIELRIVVFPIIDKNNLIKTILRELTELCK